MTRSGLAAAVASLIVLTGAVASARDRAPSMADIRRTIESSSPTCRLDVEEELRLGRTKLWFVRRMVGMADDVDPQSRAILDGLRRVEVASYRVRDGAEACPIPPGFAADLTGGGWTRTARWHDESGHGIVLQRVGGDEEIDGLLVVEIGDGSVEVVRLEGRIHAILAAAVRDDPGATRLLVGVD